MEHNQEVPEIRDLTDRVMEAKGLSLQTSY